MQCPCTHEWFELERDGAEREDADRLRRHMAECEVCRDQAGGVRVIAAAMERLSSRTRVDLPGSAAESILRRARVHGFIGRPLKQPLSTRILRARWVRVSIPIAVAAAAAVLIAVGIQISGPPHVQPYGALEQLTRESGNVNNASDLLRLAPMARAAVSEEFARPVPSADQVADLLLVAYIAQRGREDRQVDDVRFLVTGAWARRERPSPVASERPWPTLLPTALADGNPSGARPADALARARSLILSGDYEQALAAIPANDAGAVLRAWCLTTLARTADAARVLAQAGPSADRAMTRILRAEVALDGQDVVEAIRQYDALAADRDRFWFMSGYLCRYELADERAAGQRFQRLRDERFAGYVSQRFRVELAAATTGAPEPLVFENFSELPLGPLPENWPVVRARGGEFRVVEIPHGKALEQDEIGVRGAELLTGGQDWSDYTLRVDVKILAAQGDYAVRAAAYRRRGEHTGYVLELSPRRLRLVKQFAAGETRKSSAAEAERLVVEPERGQMQLVDAPAADWWYTLQIRVQHVPGGVTVAGKFWQTDTEKEPFSPQVVWTDTGQAGGPPLVGGAGGIQISGAKVLIGKVVITRN